MRRNPVLSWLASVPATGKRFIGCILLGEIMVGGLAAQTLPWMDTPLTPEQRANLLLGAMSMDEKLAVVHGCPGPYVGDSTNNRRPGIPGLYLQDGLEGVADWAPGVTVMPAPIALAASFDTNTARQYGALIGAEAYGKRVHMLLGPMINLVRVPQGGRDFEMFGEDPFLSGAIAAAHLQGIQSQGVVATVKHFICNDQETTRGNENSLVDERAFGLLFLSDLRRNTVRRQLEHGARKPRAPAGWKACLTSTRA